MPIYHYTPVALPIQAVFDLPDEPVSPSSPPSGLTALLNRVLYKLGLKNPNYAAAEYEELRCYRLMRGVEQIIAQSKMTTGECSPYTILRRAVCLFNQRQVELFTLKIAGEKELTVKSVGIYLSLARQLAVHGVDLGEPDHKELPAYVQAFTVELGCIDFIKRHLNNHWLNRSPELLDALDHDQAVGSALRLMFAKDYQEMLDDQSWLYDELWDMLWNPASSDLQKSTAQAQLEMLDSLEKEWYRAKTLEALARLTPDAR